MHSNSEFVTNDLNTICGSGECMTFKHLAEFENKEKEEESTHNLAHSTLHSNSRKGEWDVMRPTC